MNQASVMAPPKGFRILHLNSMLKGGGTDDRSVRIAHALVEQGHAVWMAGPAGREFSEVADRLGVPFHPLSNGLLRLSLIRGAAKFMRRERVQIIHARHGRDYWPAILAARLSGVRPKIVLSRHLAKSPGSWASRHFLLNQCDALLASSQFVSKVLREGVFEPGAKNPERRSRPPIHGDHGKIKVVYGGIDIHRFTPGEAKEQRERWGVAASDYVFGVAGGYTLPRGKGQREFLAAAARIAGEVPKARFLVIGRGNLKDALEADIEMLGLRKRAWLTPYSHDMPAAMNAIDCLVHPQVGTESWGSVVCEAHACGKPVIASNLDGIPEAFAAAGYGELVEPDSVEALAVAMRRWAACAPLDLEARWKLHAKVATRFSLERAAQELAEIYRTVVEGDGRAK